jgi:hypothetical protein
MSGIKYRFYPTLLDGFQSYLDSSATWNKYYGNSENPSRTEEEYEQECFQSLIDKINRVPIPYEETEKMDRGTAFNEIIDCIIAGKKSDKMKIRSDKQTGIISAYYNERTFTFPVPLCKEFSSYFKGAVSQLYCEGILSTRYGDVQLYGYIDELMPTAIHDIKTTGKYKYGKYRKNWQHRIYPYCLEHQFSQKYDFEYNVCEFGTKACHTYTEQYHYIPQKAKEELTEVCEHFIDFIEKNSHLITDKKIFNHG